MSINKFALSLALAGILCASSALAENEGSFVGFHFGSASTEVAATTTYDADINAGLCVVLLKKHGIKAFYHFGILTLKQNGQAKRAVISIK